MNIKRFKKFNENIGDILCTFCGHKAMYETLTNNNYLCDDSDCKIQYVEEIIKPLD